MKSFVEWPNRIKAIVIIGAIYGLTMTYAYAGIVGSPHDLRMYLGLGSNSEVCIVCHTPHDANGNGQTSTPVADAPLWNHSVTTATFTMYGANGTLQAFEDPQPTGASLLCLSCHDGTVAVDDYDGGLGAAGPITELDTFYLGTDLRGKHPISIIYDSITDLDLHTPSNPVTIGGYNDGFGTTLPTKTGTISSLMLFDGRVQCNTCHDVHNTFVATPQTLLRISTVNSELCLACHNL